jgi:large subunit ribosomal protein L1
MAKHGKRYRDLMDKYDRLNEYPLSDAVRLVQSMANANFDETVELHCRLGIDPRQADQQIRTTIMLPNGLGKPVTVLVFAEGEDARAAEEAGADIIADDEIIKKIQNDGWTEFDNAIAMANMMPKVGRLGRVLGPRGLMPTPKAGTVVNSADDLARVVNELKAGRIEFRNDRTGNLHLPVGKASFEYEKLLENVQAAIDEITRHRPNGMKGQYYRRVVLTSTMGPAVRVDV